MVVEETTIENVVHRDDNNYTVPISTDEDSSLRNPILRSLRIFDEFAKIKSFMEMFPLPGNDIELEFPMPPTNEGATKSIDYGSRLTDLLISFSLKCELNILQLNEVTEKAVEEMRSMLLENEPLWVYDEKKRTQVLNTVEYTKRFRELEMTLDDVIKVVAGVEATPSELPNANHTYFSSLASQVDSKCSNPTMPVLATREIVIVSVPPLCIIEIMMDARLWSYAFGDMLSRVIVLESLMCGDPSTHHGDLQVMNVEYHSPSPLVPTRQNYFARHCKQLTSNQWMVVDVPLDEILLLTNFKRRPSGCLIEGLDQHRYSKVTWIENVECDNQDVNPFLKPLIDSRFLFGAKHWVNALTRQCKRLELITQCNMSSPLNSGNAPNELLRLSDRIRRSFYGSLSSSSVHVWKPIPIHGAQNCLVRTCEVQNQDIVALIISATFWIPRIQERVLRFLQDETNRPMYPTFGPLLNIGISRAMFIVNFNALELHDIIQNHPSRSVHRQFYVILCKPKTLKLTMNTFRGTKVWSDSKYKWDMFSIGYNVEEAFHHNGGHSPDVTTSIIKLKKEDRKMKMVLLQEASYDSNESYIVYSPIDAAQMGVLDGGNVDEVSIMPCGFVIHEGGENVGGSVVTSLFKVFDRNSRLEFIPQDSIQTLYECVTHTIHAISNSLCQLS